MKSARKNNKLKPTREEKYFSNDPEIEEEEIK